MLRGPGACRLRFSACRRQLARLSGRATRTRRLCLRRKGSASWVGQLGRKVSGPSAALACRACRAWLARAVAGAAKPRKRQEAGGCVPSARSIVGDRVEGSGVSWWSLPNCSSRACSHAATFRTMDVSA